MISFEIKSDFRGSMIYCSILRNRQNGGHSQPAKKPPLDESPKRKRQEKSPPVYEDCETSHRGENCKRIRSGELSDDPTTEEAAAWVNR